jgi:hypothetical protein
MWVRERLNEFETSNATPIMQTQALILNETVVGHMWHRILPIPCARWFATVGLLVEGPNIIK